MLKNPTVPKIQWHQRWKPLETCTWPYRAALMKLPLGEKLKWRNLNSGPFQMMCSILIFRDTLSKTCINWVKDLQVFCRQIPPITIEEAPQRIERTMIFEHIWKYYNIYNCTHVTVNWIWRADYVFANLPTLVHQSSIQRDQIRPQTWSEAQGSLCSDRQGWFRLEFSLQNYCSSTTNIRKDPKHD